MKLESLKPSSRKKNMALIIKYILFFLLIFAESQSFACDSTVLALLTGKDLNASTVSKFLAVSNKLVAEGEMLNSYNIAAAKKQHATIMKDWLGLVSELGSAPMVPDSNKTEFKDILIEVAKDLGIVRKLLEKETYINIHEIIEVCVTKITILGTLVRDNTVIHNFLEFELKVYQPGVYLDRQKDFLTNSFLQDIELTVNDLEKSFSQKAKDLSKAFLISVENHRKTIDEVKKNQIPWEKTTLSYNNLKNSFVALKQQLLEDGYFNEINKTN